MTASSRTSYKLFLLFSAFVICGFLFVQDAEAKSFGISPPFLNADHLVPGSKYTQTIYLVQSQPEEDLAMKAELTIPESIRSWITVDKGFDFVIPKGVNQFPVNVTVTVPKDAGLGAYHGNLVFTQDPGKTGQVTIALGAQAVINLTVGTGIFRKFSVPILKNLDIEEGWNPRAYVKFDNEGNVPESFSGATYELYDQFSAIRLAFVQKNEGFPETPPFEVKEYTVEFPINFKLGLGQYWGSVAFYQNDKAVASQKTPFRVLASGSLSNPFAQLSAFFKGNWTYLAGGLLVVVIAVALLKLKKKRSLRSSKA